ncbi:hypothetical protein GCM10009821_19420 [Aeromicrobium halocynthiae]|uniref:YlxR domain-containing protein n=1 Tax=Aeromicrobium halocynthiae TaxID=560557 RepID=A0ABN2W116_9ACTN
MTDAIAPGEGTAGTVGSVVRTCIGCRERAEATTLVRLVAVRGTTPVAVVPDPRRTMPGRGAHLHPDPRCLERARQRKAFGRALRVEGPLDLDAVVAFLPPATNHPGPPSPDRNRSTRS